MNTEEANWPLWKAALGKLRKLPEFGYGMVLDIGWFERELGAKRDTSEFAFGLLELRRCVESEDGYYIQTQTIQDEETGIRREVAQIPSAAGHDEVAASFESRTRSYAARAVDIRAKTLGNEGALKVLTGEQKSKMEKGLEIAAVRTILLRREKSVASFLRKHAPKLIG